MEIGTGSGYQAAILAEIVSSVFTVEILPELAERSRRTLERAGYRNIYFRTGNGRDGWPEEAPFDRIIVTAAAPEIPRTLTEQLAGEGILVIPVGPVGMQTLMVMRKHAGETESESVCDCVFVKLIGQEGYMEP